MSLGQPGVLCQELKRIYLQFSFSNESAVPTPLRKFSDETEERSVERKTVEWKGVQFIPPTERVWGRGLLHELESRGFELADGTVQRRIDRKRGRKYSMVRYLFVMKGCDEWRDPNPEFVRIRSAVRIGLVRLLADAFWRARGYHNLTDGPIVGEWLSLNFEARVPLVQADGSPVVEWKKDETGGRVGDRPVPIVPSNVITVWGSCVTLLPYRP